MKKRTLHLLPNAHIDPVWLWNWREGITEAVSTCRCIVELMQENPDLTFIRGEAWFYEQIQEFAPELFSEVRELVESGRWDIVGGGYIQSDTNLPDTTAFLHQFETGRNYFHREFRRKVEACWSADSFGQSWGMVEIYAAAGLKYYAFGRPEAWIFPLTKPLFHWYGPGGSRLLSYRLPLDWYAIERDGMQRRLDDYTARLPEWDLENTALFFGLGDHGGGPSRRHIEEIRRWSAAHPELEVKFSTLHEFFQAAEAEITARGPELLPVIGTEINFAQRGYFANCQKIKFPYRRAEAAMKRAAIAGNSAAAFLRATAPDLKQEWKSLSFNAFHDILPGTCIESAAEEQRNWIGGIIHAATAAEFHSLQKLAARIDTTVPKPDEPDAPLAVPVVVFNPLPHPYSGPVEFEVALDYRPIWHYQGRAAELPVELLDENCRPIPFQRLDEEHNSFKTVPWRCRVLFHGEIPALGWRKYTLSSRNHPHTAELPASSPAAYSPKDGVLANDFCEVKLNPATHALEIYMEGREIFGGPGIAFETTPDTWGSWGCQKETPDAFLCRGTPERWQAVRCITLENGPERATLFLEFAGKFSRLMVRLQLYRGRPAVDLDLRILWNETGTRLRLVTRRAESVTYAIPGGELERTRLGDVPGGRYLILHYPENSFGIINDTLCGFGNYENCFGVTLIRGSRFCTDLPMAPDQSPERQPADLGEHRCRLSIVLDASACRRLAAELEQPVLPLVCDRHTGSLPGRGGLFEHFPDQVKLLDFKLDEHGEPIAVVQQFSGAPLEAFFQFTGRKAVKEQLPHGKIVEVRLS